MDAVTTREEMVKWLGSHPDHTQIVAPTKTPLYFSWDAPAQRWWAVDSRTAYTMSYTCAEMAEYLADYRITDPTLVHVVYYCRGELSVQALTARWIAGTLMALWLVHAVVYALKLGVGAVPSLLTGLFWCVIVWALVLGITRPGYVKVWDVTER